MVSCDPAPIAEANFEFDESLQWKKSEPVALKLDIRENSEPCELYLDVRYTTLFPFDKLQLHVKEISDKGIVIPRDVTVEIKNQEGFVGDISGDIGDIERELDSNKQYEDHGVYTYEISFNNPRKRQQIERYKYCSYKSSLGPFKTISCELAGETSN